MGIKFALTSFILGCALVAPMVFSQTEESAKKTITSHSLSLGLGVTDYQLFLDGPPYYDLMLNYQLALPGLVNPQRKILLNFRLYFANKHTKRQYTPSEFYPISESRIYELHSSFTFLAGKRFIDKSRFQLDLLGGISAFYLSDFGANYYASEQGLRKEPSRYSAFAISATPVVQLDLAFPFKEKHALGLSSSFAGVLPVGSLLFSGQIEPLFRFLLFYRYTF